jgi:hypothetical protein
MLYAHPQSKTDALEVRERWIGRTGIDSVCTVES